MRQTFRTEAAPKEEETVLCIPMHMHNPSRSTVATLRPIESRQSSLDVAVPFGFISESFNSGNVPIVAREHRDKTQE